MGNGNGSSTKTCIYCGKPVKGPGAEHFGCAMKHPHLAVAGWFFWLIGARKAEKWVKNRVRLDVIRSHVGEFILISMADRHDETVRLIGVDSGIFYLNGKPLVQLHVEFKRKSSRYLTHVHKNVMARLRVTEPPRDWEK